MNTVGEVGEAALLARLLPYLDTEGYPISAGEDDAASWISKGGLRVASTDASVEGVHFDLGWMPPEAAGWRAMALALGDLAAKGARPEVALVSLALPSAWPVESVTGFYEGFSGLARKVGMALLGGDTCATAGPAVITLTVIGSTDRPSLPRSAARPGWGIGLTGPLGSAALALRDRRVLRLEPRLEEGRRLNGLGLCCGDISDGLFREMEKFLVMAGTGCRIQRDLIPRAEGADWELALGSGEEAELVCVGPPALLVEAGLFVVGELTAGGQVEVLDAAGRILDVFDRGYQHFGG
ncbi:MAG: thiamine-phosphate kinase [Candidatus Dormibacteraeota bacterium]|nr:thiamine-phosphate kinase [Candidatus Dormibacteraeota bacterium]